MATAAPRMNMESMLNCSLDDIVKMQKSTPNRGNQGRMRSKRGPPSWSRGRVFKQIIKRSPHGRAFSRSRGRGRLIPTRSTLEQRLQQPLQTFERSNRRGMGPMINPTRRIMRSRGRGMRNIRGLRRGFIARSYRAFSYRGRGGRTPAALSVRRGSRLLVGTRLSRGRGATMSRGSMSTRGRQTTLSSKTRGPNTSLNRALARNNFRAGPTKIIRSIAKRSSRPLLNSTAMRINAIRKRSAINSATQIKQIDSKKNNLSQKTSPSDADLMSRIKIMAQLDRVPPPIAAQKGVSVAVPKAMRDQTGRYIAENTGQNSGSSLSDRFTKF